MKKVSALVALASILALWATIPTARPALADDTECDGALTGVHDNVVVPPGQDCFADGAKVRGNFKIEPGAGLVDIRNSKIRGNVQGDDFRSFDLHNSKVDGNVQVKKVSGTDSAVQVCGTRIRNDLQVEESTLERFLEIGDPANDCRGNKIGGNLQVAKNEFPLGQIIGNVVGFRSDGNLQFSENSGESEILENDIDGNLQCFDNEPPPTSAGNTADQHQGQCLA